MIAQTKPSPAEAAAAPAARERKAAPIQAVRGMNDVLPDEAPLWQRFEDAVREVFGQYGYRNVRVPIVEATPLFVRAIGEVTDVVEHEMYTFEDRLNGESLTLRPEATAGIVRAAIEHNLTYERPQRVWTAGPMFRHERPQRGRYRQFHQFDVEALLRRARRRRRADRDAVAAVAPARARRHHAGNQFDRRRRRASRAPRRVDRALRASRRAAQRRRTTPAAGESAAHPRQQEPGAAAGDRGGTETDRFAG
jgi:hypothetical protein